MWCYRWTDDKGKTCYAPRPDQIPEGVSFEGISVDEFTNAYLECALWSTTCGDETPMDDRYELHDLTPEWLTQAVNDCEAFQEEHGDLIDDNLSGAGQDFWLTRERHGAGFWDGDWPEPDATTLTKAAHAYGSGELSEGDFTGRSDE